jgi:uncharacterized membrane protein YgdD (TMEM256/DUF423 family)
MSAVYSRRVQVLNRNGVRMPHRLLFFGAMLAGFGVAAGALGAHSLKGIMSADRLVVFETAVRYQMYHAIALLIVGAMLEHPSYRADRAMQTAGWCFISGIVLFSGSLYVVALAGIRWFGAITPLGGVAFLAGWIVMARAVWKSRETFL